MCAVLRCCCTVGGCPEPATATATAWPSSRTKTTSPSTSHPESSTSSLFTTRSRRKVRTWPTGMKRIHGFLNISHRRNSKASHSCTSSWKQLSSILSLLPSECDDPSAVVVLLEEELVVIDLQTPGWPSLPTPYLAPLHSSAITCSCHISSVPPKLWERLVNAGKAQQGSLHTNRVRRPLRCTQ